MVATTVEGRIMEVSKNMGQINSETVRNKHDKKNT